MFLRNTRRWKDGKEHRYWSIVENRRCAGGKIVQRPVLYLGEINDSQREAWCRVVEGFDEDSGQLRQMAFFAWDLAIPAHALKYGIGVRLKDLLRNARRREGRYLLRTNLCDQDPAKLWNLYIQITEIEAAFKNLKDDLDLRPIYHQREDRIEAHIFISFLAYCLHVTLRARLRPHAPGLTPRAVLDKSAAIQMVDAHFPARLPRHVS